MTNLGAFLRIEIVSGIGPAFPLEPLPAGVLGIEIVFNLEAHVSRKVLRAFADDQMMVSVLHHCFGNERRSAYAFERAHGARAFLWTMHHGRVELDDALRVWQAAVTDTVVEWIEFDDVDARDECIEHI